MKQHLVFLTTAITRRDLHKETIGKFYDTYFEMLNKDYELYHIINIDMPLPLRNNGFSYTRSKQQFNKIIPSSVKKYYIINKDDHEPSFTKAYTKVLTYLMNIKNNNIVNTNALVWWLEDDWKVIRKVNFVPLLQLLNMNTNSALSICNKAPMCSLRGGPAMNSLFFSNFFNNYTTTKDPEYAIYKIIRLNEKIPVYENNIYVSLLCLKDHVNYPISLFYASPWWYKRKYINTIKMNPGKTIRYIIGIVDNDKIYYKESANSNELYINSNDEVKKLNVLTFNDYKHYIEKNSSISYISVFPHIFEDIGRTFNANNNLVSPKGQ